MPIEEMGILIIVAIVQRLRHRGVPMAPYSVLQQETKQMNRRMHQSSPLKNPQSQLGHRPGPLDPRISRQGGRRRSLLIRHQDLSNPRTSRRGGRRQSLSNRHQNLSSARKGPSPNQHPSLYRQHDSLFVPSQQRDRPDSLSIPRKRPGLSIHPRLLNQLGNLSILRKRTSRRIRHSNKKMLLSMGSCRVHHSTTPGTKRHPSLPRSWRRLDHHFVMQCMREFSLHCR